MQPRKKLVSTRGIIVDLVLCVLFFGFMAPTLCGFVPGYEERTLIFFGAIGSLCMTGVFWLALQCFRVTLADQIQGNKV